MQNKPQAISQKVIFQARFEPKLRFYDLLMPAAEQINGYPDWQTDRLTVVLKDYKNGCSLAIAYKSFSYNQDSNKTSLEKKRISEALEKLPKGLQISSFTRYGYRKKYLIPISMPFQSLVSILDVKFLGQDARMRSFLPGGIEDVAFGINLTEGETFCRLSFGPVKRKEMPKHVEFTREHHLDPNTAEEDYLEILKSYPDAGIFLDIDFYQEGNKLEVPNAVAFVEQSRQKCKEFVREFVDYIFN